MRRILIELHLDMPDEMNEETEIDLVGQLTNCIPAEFPLKGYAAQEFAVVGNSSISFLPLTSKLNVTDFKSPFESISVEATKIVEPTVIDPNDRYK